MSWKIKEINKTSELTLNISIKANEINLSIKGHHFCKRKQNNSLVQHRPSRYRALGLVASTTEHSKVVKSTLQLCLRQTQLSSLSGFVPTLKTIRNFMSRITFYPLLGSKAPFSSLKASLSQEHTERGSASLLHGVSWAGPALGRLPPWSPLPARRLSSHITVNYGCSSSPCNVPGHSVWVQTCFPVQLLWKSELLGCPSHSSFAFVSLESRTLLLMDVWETGPVDWLWMVFLRACAVNVTLWNPILPWEASLWHRLSAQTYPSAWTPRTIEHFGVYFLFIYFKIVSSD